MRAPDLQRLRRSVSLQAISTNGISGFQTAAPVRNQFTDPNDLIIIDRCFRFQKCGLIFWGATPGGISQGTKKKERVRGRTTDEAFCDVHRYCFVFPVGLGKLPEDPRCSATSFNR